MNQQHETGIFCIHYVINIKSMIYFTEGSIRLLTTSLKI